MPQPLDPESQMDNQRSRAKERKRRNSKVANGGSVANCIDDAERESPRQSQAKNVDQALDLIEGALIDSRASFDGDLARDVDFLLHQVRDLRSCLSYTECSLAPAELNPIIEYLFHYLAFGNDTCQEDNERALAYITRTPDFYVRIFGHLLPKEMIATATKRSAEIAYATNESKSADEDWQVFLRQLEQDRQRKSDTLGVQTGLRKLDDALQGLIGFTVVGGDPSIDIGAFATWATVNALRSDPDTSALIYSLDSSKSEVNLRLLSIESGLTSRQLTSRGLDLSQQEKLQLASSRLTKTVLPRLRILDGNCFEREDDDFASAMIADYRRLQSETKTHRTLIVVDRLKDLPVPHEIEPGIESDLYRLEQLEQVLIATRTASDLVGAPLMVLSDITKGEAGRRKLRKEDLLGSGRLLSKARNILLIWPTEGTSATSDGLVALTIDVAKGGLGVMRRELEVWHDSMHNSFLDAPPRPKNALPTSNTVLQAAAHRLDPLAPGKRHRKSAK